MQMLSAVLKGSRLLIKWLVLFFNSQSRIDHATRPAFTVRVVSLRRWSRELAAYRQPTRECRLSWMQSLIRVDSSATTQYAWWPSRERMRWRQATDRPKESGASPVPRGKWPDTRSSSLQLLRCDSLLSREQRQHHQLFYSRWHEGSSWCLLGNWERVEAVLRGRCLPERSLRGRRG